MIRIRQRDPSATLTPTALVHEAWLKLAASLSIAPVSRLHFKRIAARAMRHVLVEAARRPKAEKRGGDVAMVAFDEQAGQAATSADELLMLDAALDDLARVNARQAVMVESRFFGGLDVAETAAADRAFEWIADGGRRMSDNYPAIRSVFFGTPPSARRCKRDRIRA